MLAGTQRNSCSAMKRKSAEGKYSMDSESTPRKGAAKG
jgi:hypothetical protein